MKKFKNFILVFLMLLIAAASLILGIAAAFRGESFLQFETLLFFGGIAGAVVAYWYRGNRWGWVYAVFGFSCVSLLAFRVLKSLSLFYVGPCIGCGAILVLIKYAVLVSGIGVLLIEALKRLPEDRTQKAQKFLRRFPLVLWVLLFLALISGVLLPFSYEIYQDSLAGIAAGGLVGAVVAFVCRKMRGGWAFAVFVFTICAALVRHMLFLARAVYLVPVGDTAVFGPGFVPIIFMFLPVAVPVFGILSAVFMVINLREGRNRGRKNEVLVGQN